MKSELTKSDLENLAYGSCFFASGGGGSLSSGLNLLKNLPDDRTVTLVSKEDAVADTDHYTLVVAYIGSPNALEDLDYPKAAQNAFKLMNIAAGGRIKYVVPVETGALSTIVACVVASHFSKESKLELKVVDGDGAGRAVPTLNMLTYASVVPMRKVLLKPPIIIPAAILASKDNQKIEILVDSPEAVEAISRPFISSGIEGFDQAAGLAIWLMRSKDLDKALSITGTITLSLELGEFIKKGIKDKPYDQVVEFLTKRNLEAGLLFTGKIAEVTEITSGGFDMDKIVIKGTQTDVDMHIYAQNESMIAWKTNTSKPVVIAPDSICYLSSSGKVFSNADIKSGNFNKKKEEEIGVIAILSRKQLTENENIMKSFDTALTAIGYPSLYVPWNEEEKP